MSFRKISPDFATLYSIGIRRRAHVRPRNVKLAPAVGGLPRSDVLVLLEGDAAGGDPESVGPVLGLQITPAAPPGLRLKSTLICLPPSSKATIPQNVLCQQYVRVVSKVIIRNFRLQDWPMMIRFMFLLRSEDKSPFEVSPWTRFQSG